jgi:hypothetical protein
MRSYLQTQNLDCDSLFYFRCKFVVSLVDDLTMVCSDSTDLIGCCSEWNLPCVYLKIIFAHMESAVGSFAVLVAFDGVSAGVLLLRYFCSWMWILSVWILVVIW